MKALRYEWDNEIWLLHVEAMNKGREKKSVIYSRIMKNGNGNGKGADLNSSISIKPGESYRFIVSRKSIEEVGVDIRFDNDLLMKVFRLMDRAYLPTESDVFYSNRTDKER